MAVNCIISLLEEPTELIRFLVGLLSTTGNNFIKLSLVLEEWLVFLRLSLVLEIDLLPIFEVRWILEVSLLLP